MEQLRQEVAERTKCFVSEYVAAHIDMSDPFRSTGHAYIQLKNLNISVAQAKQLHLDMLIYTIGIGTIFSVTTPGIPPDEIFAQQERAYQIFMKNILEGNHEQ